VDSSPFESDTRAYATLRSGDEALSVAEPRLVFGRKAEIRGEMVKLAIAAEDERHIGTAQPRCRFHQRVEHRGEIARRAIDDLQDFGHRGFLSLGLVALGGAFIKPPLQLGVSAPKFG